MENNVNLNKHQATGWDHFRAKDLASNKEKEKLGSSKKNSINFSWLVDTLNPLNHIPIVSSFKKALTKANSSIDIVQSALGGMIYGGPFGILKGIGGWAFNKIFIKAKKANINKIYEIKEQPRETNASKNKFENSNVNLVNLDNKISKNNLSFLIKTKESLTSDLKENEKKFYSSSHVRNSYSITKYSKNKINTSA